MRIRAKLLLLVTFLGVALVVNLLALALLARTAVQTLQTIETVGLRQMFLAVQMQARLRDSEAALYRYLMEGESGFKTQFAEQLDRFSAAVADYRLQASTPDERAWADDLALTHQQAADIGAALIRLRDSQTETLLALEEEQTRLATLLAERARPRRPADASYQQAVTGMQDTLREFSLAVTDYLASPEETEPVRFTEAAIAFREASATFRTLARTPAEQSLAGEIDRRFSEMEALGSRLISGRNQQQSQFANFAAILFQANEKVLEGQIQPRAGENLAAARRQLQTTLRLTVIASLLAALTASGIAAGVAWPLLRQMDAGIQALLKGAERVAQGVLTEPVSLSGRDELSRLALAFNRMMSDLAARERRLTARLSELETLRHISLQLTGTLDPDRVLNTIAASALELVGAAEVHIFVYEASSGELEFAASAWQTDQPHRPPRRPRPHGITAAVARTGEPLVINQAGEHPLFSTPEARQWGVQAAAGFPLKRGEQILGVFNVLLKDRPTFNQDNLRILGLLSDQAAIALENARLYKNLLERENRLRTLAQKLAHIQDEERRLIGLDLHDGLTQLLLSANMHLDTLTSLVDGLSGQAHDELHRGRARLQEAIDEARRVVSELRPAALEDFGLAAGLRHYAAEISAREGWQLEFVAELDGVRLNRAAETAIFRIVQEALTNARKYAGARRVRVALQMDASSLKVEVRDWGRGFDTARLSEESQRLGLVGMQERAALLGGTCRVESRPGEGTRIVVQIPRFTVEEV